MSEKEGASTEAPPLTTETFAYNCRKSHGSQAPVLTVGETMVVREESATLTLLGDQTGHNTPHGVIKKGIYKPLATEFDRAGFHYKQIAREGDFAIYKQRWGASGSVAYEVIRIRRHNGKHIKGRWLEPAEFYPKSEEWGSYGFTLTDRDRAFNKLKQLLAQQNRALTNLETGRRRTGIGTNQNTNTN
jgi:hypothetical protein